MTYSEIDLAFRTLFGKDAVPVIPFRDCYHNGTGYYNSLAVAADFPALESPVKMIDSHGRWAIAFPHKKGVVVIGHRYINSPALVANYNTGDEDDNVGGMSGDITNYPDARALLMTWAGIHDNHIVDAA